MQITSLIDIMCQLVIGLGILNVWLLRGRKATAYRGGKSKTLKEEFAAYGLPEAIFYLVGTLKICTAIALLLGLFLPSLIQPAAGIISILMLGAVVMHLKVRDAPVKFIPASIILALSLILLLT